jgi:hypothetical protein
VELSRRAFLASLGVAGGILTLSRLSPGLLHAGPVSAVDEDWKAWADLAFREAGRRGCAYADVVVLRERSGSISACAPMIEHERVRFRVRVVHSGSWGSAEGLTPAAIAVRRAIARAVESDERGDRRAAILPRAARPDRWTAVRGPSHPQIGELLARLASGNGGAATLFRSEETYFVSSKGSFSNPFALSVA